MTTSVTHDRFEGFQLTLELDQAPWKSYFLNKDDTRAGSCRIMATPEGLMIAGDCISGAFCAPGYSIRWFASELNSGYMAEKFLRTGWFQDLAEQGLADKLADIDADVEGQLFPADAIQELRELAEDVPELEHEFLSRYIDIVSPHDADWWESVPGMGYDPALLQRLVEIQRKFRELYHQLPKDE